MKGAFTGILEQIRSHARTCLDRIIEQVMISGCPTTRFREAQRSPGSTPALTTAAFATAPNRLENARSYLEAGERGAARYELRLLRRSLDAVTNQPTPFGCWRCFMFPNASHSLYRGISPGQRGRINPESPSSL